MAKGRVSSNIRSTTVIISPNLSIYFSPMTTVDHLHCVCIRGEMRDSPEQVEISLCQYYVQRYERPSSLRRLTVHVEV